MSAGLHDRMIASKASGQALVSSITYTKVKKRKCEEHKDGAAVRPGQMFPATNKSALNFIPTAKRCTQTHPGNNAHIHWAKLKLCEFCNQGVLSKVLQCRCVCNPDKCAELPKHQQKSKKCATQQSDQAAPRYVLCDRCSEDMQTPFGHPRGTACPRANSSQ